jgi:hypothetical protein
MKTKGTKTLGLLGIGMIFAMVTAAGFTVFRAAFSDIARLGDFISAFTGAFFAFIFVKLGELGTRLYARQRIHQVALVTLGQSLQEHINRLYNGEFIANDIIKTIDATLADPSGATRVNLNYLKPIPIDKSLPINVRNIDYKNDLFNFYEDLEKLNGSLNTIQRYYDTMTANLMSGQLRHEIYIANLPLIKEKLEELKRFILASVDDCIDVATKTRLLLDDRSLWLTSAIQLGPQNYTDSLKAKIPKERKIMEKEMKDNMKASKKRIEKIVG